VSARPVRRDRRGAARRRRVNVIQAGEEHYGEEINVILIGHLVETDLSNTLSRIEDEANAVVQDLSLAAPDGTEAVASARARLAVNSGRSTAVITAIRSIGTDKGFDRRRTPRRR